MNCLVNSKKNKAVFLDRDNTIAKDVPYCSRPEDFELLPGVSEAISTLNKYGYKVVIITNQSGIARGYFTEETLELIHRKMIDELNKQGARIDRIYYCPHHPDENCDCRKPKPKLIQVAAEDLNIDISQSYMIGDKQIDMKLAENAGCKAGIFISGSITNKENNVKSFSEAVDRILHIEKNINK